MSKPVPIPGEGETRVPTRRHLRKLHARLSRLRALDAVLDEWRLKSSDPRRQFTEAYDKMVHEDLAALLDSLLGLEDATDLNIDEIPDSDQVVMEVDIVDGPIMSPQRTIMGRDPHLTYDQAQTLLHKLEAEGFQSGIDCAVVCRDGTYGPRSRRWGEDKSSRYSVSFTTVGGMYAAAIRALGKGAADVGHHPTYWIFEWKPQWEAAA